MQKNTYIKKLTLIIALIATIHVSGQTSKKYVKGGINKQNNKSNLKSKNNTIKANLKTDAFYLERATMKLLSQDEKGAMADFVRAIRFNNKCLMAYYQRANVYLDQEKYKEAITDLNKIIKIDPTFLDALTLRAKVHFLLQNKEACCKDLSRAKKMGLKSEYMDLATCCENALLEEELFIFHWAEEEKWTIESHSDDEQMMVGQLLKTNETRDNWTEALAMQTFKGLTHASMDKTMNSMFDQAKLSSPNAKLTLIEKDEDAEYPWVIFSIEGKNDFQGKAIESELWYVIQGKKSLHMRIWSIKEIPIPEDTKKKWVESFKGGKILYQKDIK